MPSVVCLVVSPGRSHGARSLFTILEGNCHPQSAIEFCDLDDLYEEVDLSGGLWDSLGYQVLGSERGSGMMEAPSYAWERAGRVLSDECPLWKRSKLQLVRMYVRTDDRF